MLFRVHSFQTGVLLSEEDYDISLFSDSIIDDHFLSMAIARMKKYHHIPTNKTKVISEISGTTAKPYRQKGTGNARQGTKRGAQHRGGASMFGPRGLKRKIVIPKKEVILAKKMLISIAIRDNKIFLVSDCSIPDHKTKSSISCLKNFSGPRFLIIHDNEIEKNNILSSRNIPSMKYVSVKNFTVYDLLSADSLIITKKSFQNLSTVLSCQA